VGTSHIADLNVTTVKIANGAVDSTKLANGAVDSTKLSSLSWSNLSFGAGWGNAAGFQSCQSLIEQMSFVRLRGTAHPTGVGATIGTLPGGSRPSAKRQFIVGWDAGTTLPVIVTVNTDGTIVASVIVDLPLDGINFDTR
jgi:hypothetical protein